MNDPMWLFEIVEDIPGTVGPKCFTFVASSEEFFKWTAHLHQRCFYEILADQQPVVLYFDVEHYTEGVDGDDKLQQTIEAIQMQVRKKWAEVRPEDLQPVVMTVSRPSLGRFKHSFHLLFRNIGFSCNHGILKKWVKKIALLPELQGLNSKGVVSSVIDTKVYSPAAEAPYTKHASPGIRPLTRATMTRTARRQTSSKTRLRSFRCSFRTMILRPTHSSSPPIRSG